MRRCAIVLVVALLALISGTAPSTASPCGTAAAECGLRQRIALAEQYLQTRPGTVGFVLRDRATGATYRNANAATPIWTASTIKLAMVADLLTRQRAGVIALTDADRRSMVAMLRNSDNDAADALWSRYGGEANAFNANFPRYGMPNVVPQRGLATCSPTGAFRRPRPTTWTG